MSPKQDSWREHGWERDGIAWFKTFATLEDARAFLASEQPSEEVRKRMEEYKARFANARGTKSVDVDLTATFARYDAEIAKNRKQSE